MEVDEYSSNIVLNFMRRNYRKGTRGKTTTTKFKMHILFNINLGIVHNFLVY